MDRRLFLIAACILAAIGCSGSKTGTVTGKVTVAGKPVKGGTISFRPPTLEGIPFTFTLADDGTYTATDLPYGLFAISVVTNPPVLAGDPTSQKARIGALAASQPGVEPTPEQIAASNAQIIRDAGPQVPAKYNDPNTSELTFTLDKPVDVYDVDVK